MSHTGFVTGSATPTLALIGGGVSVAALTRQLDAALGAGPLTVRLAARDLERLGRIARHCSHLLSGRPEWHVTACPSVAAAIEGADVVVVMLRVGGLAARLADDRMSQSFGIPGDEGLGPGGWANGLRTMPVMAALADDLVRLAPDASVLNLVAPLGLTTRVLCDRGVDAIGVCELPGVTESLLRSALDDPDTALAYAGYNHLGWFWPRTGTAAEVFAPAVSARLVDSAVLDRFGALPLKYYYWLHDPEAAGRLGIARDPDRSANLIVLRDRAIDEIGTDPDQPSPSVAARSTPWFSEALVPMLAAHWGGDAWNGYANLPNNRLVPVLDPDGVVEVPLRIDATGVHPMPCTDDPPPPVLKFLHQVGRSEALLHQAWSDGDHGLVEAVAAASPHYIDAGTIPVLADAVRRAAAAEPSDGSPHGRGPT